MAGEGDCVVSDEEPLLDQELLPPIGWPVGGFLAHPDFVARTESVKDPKILRYISGRVRTERRLAKARSASIESSTGPASSGGLSQARDDLSADGNLQISGQVAIPQDDSVEEAVLQNTGISSSFVTRVEVLTPSGECDSLAVDCCAVQAIFTNQWNHSWTARDHRRNKLHGSGEVHENFQTCRLFDIDQINALLENPVEAASFAVGPVFFVGSLLFVFGCAAEENDGFWEGEWSVPMKDYLVNIPFLAGALLFFFGCYFAVVESINVDFEENWHEWMQNDQQGEAPTLRLSPLASEGGEKEFLSYYGCLIQFVGSIVFLVGAFSSLLYAHNMLPEDGVVGEYVMVDIMFFLGGLCFVVGACFLVAEGTHSWWRGCIMPLRRQELISLPYWIGILNWVGSLMFLGGGIQGLISNLLDTVQEEALTSITWLAGSVLFAIQGILMYLEMINPAWKAHGPGDVALPHIDQSTLAGSFVVR